MFPQSGNGFIWDHNGLMREGRFETTIFVPQSKKIFPISISTRDIKKDDINSTSWIEWKSVGVRDAVKPFPIIDARLMDGSKEIIQPEYTNQTVFKSVLIFPDRDDLVAFVGKHNAWSPHVGIVTCSEDEEIKRGVYCTGYIELDSNSESTESSFKVTKLKYPEGYCSNRDKIDFENITRKIELAMEEANILARKGKGPVEETRVIPPPSKAADTGGFYEFTSHNERVIKTDLNGPGWIKRKSKKEIADIEKASDFIKHNRFQYFIVYKERERGPGFVGWTPVIGSVVITSQSHKTTDQRVEVGQTLNTRVEYNKHSCSFVVESIVEIEKKPLVPFDIQYNKQKGRTELIILCMTLDLKGFTLLPKCYCGKRVGVVEHPTLKKVLVSEADALNERWNGKEVTAQLIHYEGIENDTPDRIRLILRYIEGLSDDDPSNDSSNCVDITCGIPDEIESDDEEEEDDDNDEKCDKKMDRIESTSPSNTFKQYDGKGGSSTNEKKDKKGRGFNDYDGYQGENGGGFDNNYGGFDSSESGGYGDNGRRGGYGGNERGQGRGRGRGRGGSDYHRESRYDNSSEELPMSGHGFAPREEQQKIHIGQGILVYYSMQSSIIYMMKHRLVEYNGDAKLSDLMLGDSVEFETEPARTPSFAYRVVRGSLKRISNLVDYKMVIENGELYILIPGCYLTPNRKTFECKPISDLNLDPHTPMIKLSNGEFVQKTQVKIGHSYHIYIKFSIDEMKWIFDCINVDAPSFGLEEEDEIDKEKKLLHERNRNESRMTRSRNGDGDGGYERDSRDGRDDRHSMRSEPNSQWSKNSDERDYGDDRADKYSMSSNSGDFSRRGTEYSNGYEGRETRCSAPSRQSSKAPSILSASTQLTSTSTTTNEKELRRELSVVKRMLKNVWGYKQIQKIVKAENYFLYESVDDFMIKEAEDKSENNQ